MKYQASKWIDLNLFLSLEELRDFFPDVHLIRASGVIQEGEEEIAKEKLFSLYEEYLKSFAPPPPLFLTTDPEAVEKASVAPGKLITRPRFPVIQCREHILAYSKQEGKFRSMVRNPDSLSWGLQFSFPQLFEDPETGEVLATQKMENGKVFHEMQKWARLHTKPTPLLVEGKRHNLPARVGKGHLEEAARHPKLSTQEITLVLD